MQKNILEKTLASDNPKIKRVMDNAKDHEIQIIYTQILRDKNYLSFEARGKYKIKA